MVQKTSLISVDWERVKKSSKVSVRLISKFLLQILIFAFILFLIYLLNKYWISNKEFNHALFISYLSVLQWPIVIIILFVLLRPWLPNAKEYFIKKFSPQSIEYAARDAQETAQPTEEIKNENFDLGTSKGRTDALKNVELRYGLEKIYRNIFGTQIKALQLLYQYKNGLQTADLLGILDEHKSRSGIYGTVQELMAYPVSFDLVNYLDQKYNITNIGLLFLEYLAEENIINPNLKLY